MKQNGSRAQRRAERERIKNQRKAHWYFWDAMNQRWDIDPRWLGKKVNTNTQCSCPGCTNPRRWRGEDTIQQKRQKLREHDED